MGRPGCSSCCDESEVGCVIDTYDVCYERRVATRVRDPGEPAARWEIESAGYLCENVDPEKDAEAAQAADDDNNQEELPRKLPNYGKYIESLIEKQFDHGGFRFNHRSKVKYSECKKDFAEYQSQGGPWLHPEITFAPQGLNPPWSIFEEEYFPYYTIDTSNRPARTGKHMPLRWKVRLILEDDNNGEERGIIVSNAYNPQPQVMEFRFHGEQFGFKDLQGERTCLSRTDSRKNEIPEPLLKLWKDAYLDAINPDDEDDVKTRIQVIKRVTFRSATRTITQLEPVGRILSTSKRMIPCRIQYELKLERIDGGDVEEMDIEDVLLYNPQPQEDESFGYQGEMRGNKIELFCWRFTGGKDSDSSWQINGPARNAMADFGVAGGSAMSNLGYDAFDWCLTYPFMKHTDGTSWGPTYSDYPKQSGPRTTSNRLQMSQTMPNNSAPEDYVKVLSGQNRRGISITNVPRKDDVLARHFDEHAFKCVEIISEDFRVFNPYVTTMAQIPSTDFEHYGYRYPRHSTRTYNDGETTESSGRLRDGIIPNKKVLQKPDRVLRPEPDPGDKPEREDFMQGPEGSTIDRRGDEDFAEALEDWTEKREKYEQYVKDLVNNYNIIKQPWLGGKPFTYTDIKINLEKDIPQRMITSYAPLGLWNDNATSPNEEEDNSRPELNDPEKAQSGTIDTPIGGAGDTTVDVLFPRQQRLVDRIGRVMTKQRTITEKNRVVEPPLWRNGDEAFYLPQSLLSLLVNGTSMKTGLSFPNGFSNPDMNEHHGDDRLRDIIVVKSRSMRKVPTEKIEDMMEHGLVWYPIGGCETAQIENVEEFGPSGLPQKLNLRGENEPVDVSEVESASDVFSYAMGDSTYQLQTTYLHGMFRNPFYYRVRSISLINPEKDLYYNGGGRRQHVHLDDIAYVEEDMQRGSVVITHDGKEHLNPTRIKLTSSLSWNKIPEETRCPEDPPEPEDLEYAKVLARQDGDTILAGGRECFDDFAVTDAEDYQEVPHSFVLEPFPLHGLFNKESNDGFGKLCVLSDNSAIVTPRISFKHVNKSVTHACCDFMFATDEQREQKDSSGEPIIPPCPASDTNSPGQFALEKFYADNIVYQTGAVSIMNVLRQLNLGHNMTFDGEGKPEFSSGVNFKGSQKPNFGYLFGTYLTLEFELEQLSPALDWGVEEEE